MTRLTEQTKAFIYELCITQQHRSTLTLLRLLDKDPEMLDEVSNI